MLPPMSASSIRDKDRVDLPESPNLREAAEMLQQPTDAADDPEGLDFLLEDGSAQNVDNRDPSEIIDPPLSQIKPMRDEPDQQDETKLDFSDHDEAATESVLIDDYGVEDAEVVQPAFIVDED